MSKKKKKRNRYHPETIRSHKSRWKDWLAWCAKHGEVPIPASADAVVRYAIHLESKGMAPGTVLSRWASIRVAHRERDLDPPSDERIRRVMRRQDSRPHESKAVDPLTERQIRAIVAAMGSSERDLRERAMLLLGYTAGLTPHQLATLEVRDLCWSSGQLVVSVRGNHGRESDRTVVVESPGSEFCAVAALRAWMARGAVESGPVFRRDKKTVGRVVKRRARRAGFDPAKLSGLSLRKGHLEHAERARPVRL